MRYRTAKLRLHDTSSKVTTSPHLPENLAFPLFHITIRLSLAETMFLLKDSSFITSHSPLHDELSAVQPLFYFHSDNAKNISVKQTEEHWEIADHTARGFSNACLQLTQILLQLVSLFNDNH